MGHSFPGMQDTGEENVAKRDAVFTRLNMVERVFVVMNTRYRMLLSVTS